ncbi:hypothetical protein RJ640_024789 [Escallonia rubra]|uniref:CCHC-type domain-containing protein n=1 Tax=Escallonia rubra TaxID=112253 RepID=A0AA88RC68_9ASTE|nr:hypothetical protein RJ640_024789 [Escallonia rubra]
MARLIRSLSTNVTKSHTSLSKNIHELNIESIEKDLNNWSIPKVNPSSLYVKQFEFKQTYSIKSVEQTMDISKDNQSFQLFSKSALEKHKRKFRYVHIGLVQIGITSLTKEGLDTHVWAALRDDRHLSFDDSLLGMVETSLCNGPMYFNCYPNFSVSLSDPHIMDVLTLDIKTQRYNMRPQAQNLVLIYRIYYKAMSTICPAFKQIADPGKSVILFQSNPDKTNVMLPRRIKFNELTSPEDWIIENKATHRQVNPQNTQIDHIIETPEGDVKIRFSQPETSSQNYKILHSGSSSQSARYSCSSIPSQNFQSCQNSEYHSIPPSRSSRDPKIIFQGIRNNNSSVPETMYTVETPSEMPSSSGQNQNNYNPSVHDFDYNVLVIEDFQIDHKKLNDEFYAKHNRTNRAWYRISFSTEQRAQYKELFFQTLKAYKTYFPFFGWFYSYCLDNNIEIPEYMNPQKQINVFKRITREWYIWPTHEKQESIHPPFNKFAMKGDMNSNFLAAPLKHIVDTSTSNHLNSVTAGEIQSLAEQSNYTNIILSTIGEQTTRIEDTIFQVKDVVSDFYSKMQPPKGISDNIFGTPPSFNLASSSSSVVRNIEQPLIKPSIDLDSRFKLNSEEPSGEFLKELMSKLGQIKTPKEKYPKVETSQSSPKHINMIGDIGSESEIEPDKLEKQFITAIGATNSRPPLRNYYTRPTPVDMQLEEKNFSNPSSFNGSSIYEWNLDGMTDYQVITLLQHMLMAANSARNRNLGESEAVIARYLIAGFTGQLRGWWDFYLTPTDQNNILNSIKIEPNGNPILINEQPLSDAVTTLVTAITKHFIGNASTVLERGRELLINLRCPTLTHFRWYKDVFLSKLYQRSDAQQDFWKERFIVGLPNLFSERVRTRIRNKHNGALPFSLYTFGELISEICAEGLVLCNDIKLKNQLKKEHKSGRTELRQFCYQFGYDTLSVPNYGTKEKVSKTRRPFRKPKFSKKYRKEESSRPFKRSSKRKSFPKSKVICHKCGKPGHYANKCYTKQKINELIIDEDLRKQLNEILLNPSDSEDNHSLELNNIDGDINSSCSSSNHSSDHEDTCHDCNSKTDYYKAILDMNGLSINVITSEESIILDLLNKIDDPEKKKRVIFKYLHGKQSPPTPNDSKQIPIIGNTFNFSTVMDRLQTIEPKGPTIQDLQGEILSLKRDVKTLSTRISLLELHNIEEVKSEEEEEIYLNDNNNRLKINPDIINDTKIPSPSKEQEILSIDRVVFQKWYVSIKIVISKDFTFEGIALIDSGADLNCIKEGLVPTKYCETTRQALTTANNGRMKINYKISESWVCNDGICLKTHFIVVRGLSQSIILGTHFLSLLNPMTVDDKGIHSKALDHDICFKFINTPQEQIIHSLKKELIFRQNQICFLNEDLKFQKINRSVEFASKFPDEIREKTQLQRFLGSLNYIADFYQDLYKDTKVLYQRLQKNPQPWTIVHTQAIRRIKLRAKTLPCLCLPLPEAFKIVETDASDIGYGGILKQKVDGKMTPPRASSQKSGKGLLPRPNRYNLRKSIGSSSSQTNQEAMLGKFENSGYNAHAHCPDIIQIEDEEQDLSPIEVANNYLTNGWAYPQKASGKSRDYYEEILRLTKSAVLTHNFEKPPRHSSRNIELPFQFSKVEILKFITKKQWGIDPTRIRELPPHFSPRHFNYFDYIDAWNHVLLYQNPSHKHSWFIFFSRNFDGNFPNWIANWWLNYGPDFEEWPSTQVTEAYQLYAPMVKGLPKLQFMADFSIPWILCWQYAIQKSTNSSLEYPPTLVRQFGSKWWPKFDDSHCNIEAVTELFPTLKAASTKWKSYPKTKSHALHCEAEFSKRKNEILCRLSKEKPFLNKKELLQVVTFEMLKMSEEDYNADSDNSANSTKESSSGKEGSDEPVTDNMSTGPTIDNMTMGMSIVARILKFFKHCFLIGL